MNHKAFGASFLYRVDFIKMVDVMVKTIMPHVIGMEATVVTMQILNGKNIMKFVILAFQESPSRFENSCFQQRKGAFTPDRVSPRSKKRRLFDS